MFKLPTYEDQLKSEVAHWKQLYKRAINEANGLTNYIEDRPELRQSEKRLIQIEEEARKY